MYRNGIGRPRIGLALLLVAAITFLTVAATVGCSTIKIEPPADPYERIEVDDGGYVLSGARRPPDEEVIKLGPYTLQYAGAHVFVKLPPPEIEIDDGSPEAFEPDLEGGISPSSYAAIYVDEAGREWHIIDHDPDMVAELVAAVDRADEVDGDRSYPEPEYSAQQTERGPATRAEAESDAAWVSWDCSSPKSDKWVFIPGSEVDLDSVNESQRIPISDGGGDDWGASSVLLADNLVMTAGHASPDVGGNNPDQVCIRVGKHGSRCRDIVRKFENGRSSCSDDWELLKVDPGFGTSYKFSLASGDDDFLEEQKPRLGAYPSILHGPLYSCRKNDFLKGERNLGEWHAIRKKQIRLDITAGGNSSGGPYYFWNSNKGKYMLIGVHHGRGRTEAGDKYACGPKVPYWREEIISAAALLGVKL